MDKKRILVVGDIFLDSYWNSSENRINPEAKAKLVNLNSIDYRLGGAANVALGLKSLGAKVELMGRIGPELNGLRISQLVNQAKISNSLRIYNNYKSPEKIRVVTDSVYCIRVDIEEPVSLTKEEEGGVFSAIRDNIEDYSVIILSDYGKNYLSERLCQMIIGLARVHGVFIMADPKKNNVAKYFNVNLITPNQHEAEVLSGKKQLKAISRFFSDHVEYLLVTMGQYGMSLYNKGELIEHYPAANHEVTSVCGAGDATVAGIAYFISYGKSVQESIRLTNPLVADALNQKGTIVIQH